MLLQDTIRINNTIVNSIQDVTGRAAKWALIFDVLINIGVFLFTVFYNKLEVGSIGFNVAMSQMIVGIAVSILLFALAIVSVVATIFLALLALVDVILLAICNFDNRAPDSFVCRGLLGSFTQAVADLLYKYTVPIQLSRSDRLALNVQSATLSDEAKGYSVGNQVNLTLDVTNHLYPDAPSWLYSIKGHGAFYSKEVPASFLQRANFAYYLTAAANGALANNLNLGAISWTQQGGGVNYSLSHTFQATGQAPLQPAGINRGFSYYLTEAVILPVMSCWLSPLAISVRKRINAIATSAISAIC
ncbi:MAG: hypothetical protein R2932_45170 [Caldilineaceae bacterium]